MKRGKMLTSKGALLAGGLAIASTVLATMPALAETKTFDLTDKTNAGAGDYPTVTVTLDDTSNPGKVTVNVQVNDGPTGYTGDLRALWFNLPNAGGVTVGAVGGGPITGIEGASNETRGGVGNSAGLNGMKASFNLGVEIGDQGLKGGRDDYQTTTFTLDGVSLSDFASSAVIGSRLMSVGDASNGRGLSSKTGSSSIEGNYDVAGGGSTGGGDTSGGGDTAGGGDTSGGGDTAGGGSTGGGDTGGGVGDAEPVPEPITVAGWLVGGGAIAAWRRRNKKRA